MRGLFVDANESLAVIFERLEQPGDPKVRIHRDPDVSPEQLPGVLDGAEIAIVDHTALPTGIVFGGRRPQHALDDAAHLFRHRP